MASGTVNAMNSRKQQGMSLIELMVVVAIVGILAAIAYPSYQNAIRKSNRTEAKVELERRAQALEKCYTRFQAYSNGGCDPFVAAENTTNGYYSIAVANRTATTYTLTATAIGRQALDTRCATLVLQSTGLRTSAPGPTRECW